MNWNSWQDFAHMGGHGLYVWGSTGVVLLALLAEVLALKWQEGALLSELKDDQ
jgi:heme exporter protein D